MRLPPNYPSTYFDQFRTTRLKLKPFDRHLKSEANTLVASLRKTLENIPVDVYHRGSTLFEIPGKGDIDIGINVPTNKFKVAQSVLSAIYGPPSATGKNFAAFYKDTAEISLMTGYPAKVDMVLTRYIKNDPKIIEKYLALKQRFSYSKREYLIKRNIFFRQIIKKLPTHPRSGKDMSGKIREVAIVIFYDQDLNILVQQRGSHSKLGEKYGFWGGGVEKNETYEQAIRRELIEELNYTPTNLQHWGTYTFEITSPGSPNQGSQLHGELFLSPITPSLLLAVPQEGDGKEMMTIDRAIKNQNAEFGHITTTFLRKVKADLLHSLKM